MELAPAPVNLSVGVLVSQSPPSVPPGAGEEVDDEQDPDEPISLCDPDPDCSRGQ